MSEHNKIICPECGNVLKEYKNPTPTVDIIIELNQKIVLIKRCNIPYGWAIPGGFVDYEESVEAAALREAEEETSLKCQLKYLLGVYSDPARDKRLHTISTVFVASTEGIPKAADDALDVGLFTEGNLPSNIVFDHRQILSDYFRQLECSNIL
ncbi:NUDIX hydrolase [bacterium]|nr:NUDIX hydrolase [bacterium]